MIRHRQEINKPFTFLLAYLITAAHANDLFCNKLHRSEVITAFIFNS